MQFTSILHICVCLKKKEENHTSLDSWIQAISTPSPFYRLYPF